MIFLFLVQWVIFYCILYILSVMLGDSGSYLNLVFYQAFTDFRFVMWSLLTLAGGGSNDNLISDPLRCFPLVPDELYEGGKRGPGYSASFGVGLMW